jgi:hypothetical protein
VLANSEEVAITNKNDNKCLLDLKINLDRLRKPTDITKVAFLVDREDFLNDIKQYRNELDIHRLIPREELKYWNYLDVLVRKDIGISHAEKIKRNRKVKNIVEKLMKKYKRETPEYWQIIFASLLSGEVIKSDMAYKVYPVYTSTELTIEGSQTFLAIFPNTTQKDLVKAFNSKEVQFLLKQQEQQTKQHKDDKWNEIKKIRKWYWWRVKGLTYSKIAEKEGAVAINSVGVMLSRYKRALSKPIN